MFIGINSSVWFGTVVFVINMRNFFLSRGIVVGFLKGYVGFSVVFYIEIYSMVFNEFVLVFLFFFIVGIFIMCIFMMYFIRNCILVFEEDFFENVYFLFI